MEEVYKQLFYMKYYGGWSFIEAYNLPTMLRQWFSELLLRQLEKESEDAKNPPK